MNFLSAGDCPICSTMGELVIVRGRATAVLFVLCPACGVAWREPPKPFVVDALERPDLVAPGGIDLATRSDIERAGKAHWILRDADPIWADAIGDYLR